MNPSASSPPSALYSRAELTELLGAVGDGVQVDRSVRFIGGGHVRIGNRVRIDCFGLLSAGPDGIEIGDNVHIGAGGYLFGGGGRIALEDFAGLSSRVAIYTATDDYTGAALTNPTVPDEFRTVKTGAVRLGRHVIVGSGSVILPGVALGFGAAVGALTVVRKNVRDCEVVYGNPMQRMPKPRDGARLRALEQACRARQATEGQE